MWPIKRSPRRSWTGSVPQNITQSFPALSGPPTSDDNTDALLYRLNLIDQAEKEIIFSTFDFNVDEAGKDIMASLLSAAERGVRIRMLVDGFSGMLDVNNSPWFEAMASHENIELKIYNPIHFYAPWKMQARLHDKYLIN